MKKIITISALLLLYSLSFSQTPIVFSKVIATDSIGKANIYTKVFDWFATTFNSANDVIQMSDKEAGVIVGNGLMDYGSYYSSYYGIIKYNIRVDIKDDRIKVELSGFYHKGKGFNLGLITDAEEYTTKGMYKKFHNDAWNDMKQLCDQYSNSIITSLEESLNKKASDW